MVFSTIVIAVIILYALGYAGMIVYDLFLRKDAADFMPKPRDMEIDISDEAGQFRPVLIEKEDEQPHPAKTRTGLPQEKGSTGKADEAKSKEDNSSPAASDTLPPADQPMDDAGPRQADEETRCRIRELVNLRRQEILADEVSGRSVQTDPEVCIIEPVQSSSSPSQSDVGKTAEPLKPNPAKPPHLPKSPRPSRPPKQPEHHNDALFDMEVAIDRARQHTKMEGGQTAEQVSEQAKRASLDEVLLITREINSFWEKKEGCHTPDEEEMAAIEKSRNTRREAPPNFRI